jgi:hypothetical protein
VRTSWWDKCMRLYQSMRCGHSHPSTYRYLYSSSERRGLNRLKVKTQTLLVELSGLKTTLD